jgi:hypothetical protein
MAIFIARYNPYTCISVKAASFKQARKRIQELGKAATRLRLTINFGGYVGVSNHVLVLRAYCPHCTIPSDRLESGSCIMRCGNCFAEYTSRLSIDDCRKCKRQVDCLVLKDAEVNRRHRGEI